MDKKETEQQTQPAPTKEDKLDKLIEAIGALTTHLTTKKEEPTQPAKAEPVYEGIRFYEEHDATRPYIREKPKTIGELTQEAQESLVHERNGFLSDIIRQDRLTTSYDYGRNKTHFDEYAFINIYENSSPIFKELYRSMYEKLLKCDYRGILNDYMITQKNMDTFLANDKEKYHSHNMQSIKLTNLALNLINNRTQLG